MGGDLYIDLKGVTIPANEYTELGFDLYERINKGIKAKKTIHLINFKMTLDDGVEPVDIGDIIPNFMHDQTSDSDRITGMIGGGWIVQDAIFMTNVTKAQPTKLVFSEM